MIRVVVTFLIAHFAVTPAFAQPPAQPGQPHRIVVLADGGSLRVQWEVNGDVQWTSYRLDFLSSPSGPVVAKVTVWAKP